MTDRPLTRKHVERARDEAQRDAKDNKYGGQDRITAAVLTALLESMDEDGEGSGHE